jgi:hypothetical protein
MNHSYQQKSLTTNPCGEISLGGFEHCHIDHSFSILDIFAKMDDISNAAFTECVGNNKAWKTKRKNKKLWRSVYEEWTPTNPELT